MKQLKHLLIAHQREALLFATLFLVATLCFALGYEADREFNGTPIIIEKCNGAASLANSSTTLPH